MQKIQQYLETLILEPLASELAAERKTYTAKVFSVTLDLNREFVGGRKAALLWLAETAYELAKELGLDTEKVKNLQEDPKNKYHYQYSFIRVEQPLLDAILAKDKEAHEVEERAIHKVWKDFPIHAL